MAKSVDYYKLLGVGIFANEKEIRSAYLAKIKQYHPDTYKGSKREAENITAELNIAYDILKDKNKKFVYDAEYGFDKQRSDFLRQKQKEAKKAQKKKEKLERKKTNVTSGDYAPEKNAKERMQTEQKFNEETEQKTEKIKTNLFTKEPKKEAKRVKRRVLTPEEKKDRRERISLDIIIVILLVIVVLLVIFFNK